MWEKMRGTYRRKSQKLERSRSHCEVTGRDKHDAAEVVGNATVTRQEKCVGLEKPGWLSSV